MRVIRRQCPRVAAALVAVFAMATAMAIPAGAAESGSRAVARPVSSFSTVTVHAGLVRAEAARIGGQRRAPLAEGRIAGIALRLSSGHRLAVRISPLMRTGRVAVSVMTLIAGRVSYQRQLAVGPLRPGRAITELMVLPRFGSPDTGIVVQLSLGHGVVQSQFMAARSHDGRVVTSASYQGLADAALTSDLAGHRITHTQFATAESRLHEVARFNRSTIRIRHITRRPEAMSAQIASATVGGTITYHDLNGTQRPVRNALVGISHDGGQSMQVTGRTDGTGAYSLSFQAASCPYAVAYQVEVLTDDGVGTIQGPNGADYSVLGGPLTPCPGDSVTGVNVDIPSSNDAGKAFALLDALDTVGSYYASVRQSGWDSSLTVHYPDGSNGEYTDSSSHNIYVPGGSTSCGGACPEEAFDWDALAHESGHVVQMQGGFYASIGGTHYICNNDWAGSTSKSAALGLAWNEGWATFYGLNALQEQGYPSGIPGVQNGVYNDNDPKNVNNFGYTLDDNGTCPGAPTPSGDDSEMAVQRALWEFHDTDYDKYGGHLQWPMSDILSRLESAKPATFTAAYQALISGQTASSVVETQATLSAIGFAPTASVTPGTGGAPPTVSWQPGGSSAHPNNSFKVQFINNANGSVIFQATKTGTNYSYKPTASTWQQINGYSSASVQVTGSQTTSPVSGPFTSSPAAIATSPSGSTGTPKILIVGDSISNGVLGDYTWRYRLWQNLTASNTPVQFVGHRSGTENIYDDPADLAAVNGQTPPADNYANPTDGYYNSAIDSTCTVLGACSHDALWGWTYNVAKNHIAQDVSAYQPNYLLVELGFNDLAFLNGPSGALADAKSMIDNARAADPSVKILLANVVTRTPLCGYPTLNSTITSFNASLAAAIPGWSTSKSPVRLVDISSGYDPAADSYDGLHPNGVGEYVIADAFSTALASDFGVGTVPGPPPSSVPGITLTTPASVKASIASTGVLLQWSHVYGASGYKIFERDITGNPSPLPAFTELPLALPGDHWYAGWGTVGHTYQYEVAAARGDTETSPSSPVTITMPASEPTADPPANITVTPAQGSMSITLSWSAPTGNPNDSTISDYQVFWEDANSGCTVQIPSEALTGGLTSWTIGGLTAGHQYNVAVASVNAAGGGAWGGAPGAIAGDGAPAAPVISAASSNQLTWAAVPGATGYWIYQANPFTPPNPPTWTRLIYEVPQGWNGTLSPGIYTVTAANGTLESPQSNQQPLPPPGMAPAASPLTESPLTGGPGSLNPLGWMPAWLRAAPNAALIPPSVMTRA